MSYSTVAIINFHRLFFLSLLLQDCLCEVDVSIVDRITAVLNPQPLCKTNGTSFGAGQMTVGIVFLC